MKPLATTAFAALALTLCLTTSSLAQAVSHPPFTDPANLRGERPRPRDGRELPIDLGASGLQQLLRKLSTRASILNIVAHPDDEDGGMLTLYSRGLGARVADLSLTRGEGGQNAMTADFEDALGLLRTQELLANDRYVGVDQMFGTEVDFGFSKTKEEAFAKWTHERVLYDAVRAIRLFRPMVITATFIGGVTDGHGQHQVSGQIAQEAFLAAGDPAVFPELTAEGILPWQPLKVFARVPMQAITPNGLFDYATGQYTPARFTNYVTGEVSTTPPTPDVAVHEGTLDPALAADTTGPRSYIQVARLGLSQQKSQMGPGGRSAPIGVFDVAYHLYGSCLPSSSISEKICHLDPSLAASSRGAAARPAVLPAPANPPAPASLEVQPGFFDGIDTSILAIQDLAPDAFPTDMLSYIARGIQAATEQFDPAHPEKIAPALAASLKIMDELIPEVERGKGNPIAKASALHELRIKRVQLNNALALSLGVRLEASAIANTADFVKDTPSNIPADITPDQPLKIGLRLTASQTPSQIQDLRILSNDIQTTFNNNIHADVLVTNGNNLPGKAFPAERIDLRPLQIEIPATAKPTAPYFHRNNIEQPVYDLADPALRNAPSTPLPIVATSTLSFQGAIFTVSAGVTGTRAAAEGTQPLAIVSPFNISLSTHAQVLPLGQKTFTVLAYDHSSLGGNWNFSLLNLKLPSGYSETDERGKSFSDHTFTINVPKGPLSPFTISATGFEGGGPSRGGSNMPIENPEGFRPIGYGDLPRTNFYTPATTRIVPVDLILPTHHNIAYLPGTGDAVPEALASINLTPTILSVSDLTPANLSRFDIVILGVRTYAAHPDLHGAPTQALLDYAKSGGNVVVQYQTTEFTAADAPFPLALGTNEKVVDETDPVRLIEEPNDPGIRLLVVPNRIATSDFNGWIEERGHGFLSTWDPHYSAPTEVHDPGQNPQRGGLITVQLGSDPAHTGRWTYCAFALYRQLPEAVPGAFRLFMNLLNP